MRAIGMAILWICSFYVSLSYIGGGFVTVISNSIILGIMTIAIGMIIGTLKLTQYYGFKIFETHSKFVVGFGAMSGIIGLVGWILKSDIAALIFAASGFGTMLLGIYVKRIDNCYYISKNY